MTIPGSAALYADGAPAAPAPPPGGQPRERMGDLPCGAPFSSPSITVPAPLGRRMARIQFSAGTEFRSKLH
ncbi:hypothetical protein K3553_13135 [Leisingera aquaemixtae]|uniref:hypothetical protein n=1 Tax=Leisingera aquaemixtae TaxID=1396826 RepID=UPI0021A8A24B|nr:hypothetical protein [Leisingera aquaemixtae]UWQ23914.1 hypothetical protein K3553_13135 [Leisingera aquaemixtae]